MYSYNIVSIHRARALQISKATHTQQHGGTIVINAAPSQKLLFGWRVSHTVSECLFVCHCVYLSGSITYICCIELSAYVCPSGCACRINVTHGVNKIDCHVSLYLSLLLSHHPSYTFAHSARLCPSMYLCRLRRTICKPCFDYQI